MMNKRMMLTSINKRGFKGAINVNSPFFTDSDTLTIKRKGVVIYELVENTKTTVELLPGDVLYSSTLTFRYFGLDEDGYNVLPEEYEKLSLDLIYDNYPGIASGGTVKNITDGFELRCILSWDGPEPH